ncbi:isoleucine--tRNA ligase [Cesiribacter andamanensis]|uniref:Isoleucine--tRNA ligase n=1 Tax=Cesiribacter andamanensis AMV16 TaxID=1279009 RepID=M7N6K9_9BACT|nr:isoleucine--tRNA ligase [Cesiribacter andamanensis]EMR04243.1 Isoleucine--tRNA ligase [Cesiribacter andamanensis AMV16]
MAQKYPEYKGINYADIAEQVLTFWKEKEVFERSVSEREGAPTFTFFEGPPSANGTPGIHHVMARTVKDIFCRYKTMQGFQVKRKGGWDTHGLPVELQVEKELGITKEDIGKKISVEEYNRKCREAVMKFKDQWDELTQKMGYWVDLDKPYITFEPQYIESLWHLLKKLYDKGLLYKGYTIQPYSPGAGTGLSSHELNQPGCYRNVKDVSATALFKVKGTERDYLMAWTTTPWTLPSNNSLAVGKNITYVKVATYNPYTYQPINVILAKDRLPAYFNEKAKEIALEEYKEGDKLIPWQVLDELKGSQLVGTSYEQLMPYIPLAAPALTVLEGDFVTTEDGTGIVHLAQAFGADDYRVSVANGVPGVFVKDEDGNPMPAVDKQGRFVKEMGDLAGRYVKEEFYADEVRNAPDFKSTDVYISIKLKEEGKAFKVEKYEHSYPHCWRTDKPILYYPLESWFIKTTAYKEQLVRLNRTINWKPESTGIGRFGNWLENLVDWNLSRSRYWGTPLPIWRTEDKKEEKCIGSLAELKAEVAKAIAAGIDQKPIEGDFDPHRPFVDEVYLVSDSGKKMTREADLIDVWFDSGAMPYAQWHWPFEAQDVLKENFPADFIAEGVDQTRGWFFTLHALAVMLFDDVAFKNVIANGLVLDKNGNKMSKRLGNAIDPFKTLAQYGPDATRWYMIANANPWDNLKFDLEGIVEVQRRFFGTLHNTYNFFALYANLDGFRYQEGEVPLEQRTESDRWIISRLNSLIADVERAYNDYEPTKAARAISDFTVDDLSNWYVRLNRKRFWRGDYTQDKQAAYQTLYDCLEVIARLSAPIAPFYAELLYRNLNGVSGRQQQESVHLALFPKADQGRIDLDLEERMHDAQIISSLVHSLRKKEKIKVRQPLSRILIPILNQHQREMISAVEDLILNEVNVKSIEYIDDASGVLVKQIKPNLPRLGKTYGPRMKEITGAVAKFEQADIARLEREGVYTLELPGGPINLTLEDVLITSQDIPGWSVASEEDITVALDMQISDELRQEGIARDLVNRLQNLRKDMGLDVQDKISITVARGETLVNAALEANREYICTETQALQLQFTDQLPEGTLLEMDDVQLRVQVEQV